MLEEDCDRSVEVLPEKLGVDILRREVRVGRILCVVENWGTGGR